MPPFVGRIFGYFNWERSICLPILTQIIKLRTHLLDYPIKSIRLDNACEFTSQVFDDYCSSLGIVVEDPVPHVHTQNGLVESMIKHIQLIS